MDENKKNRWIRLEFLDGLLKALMLRLNVLLPGDAPEGAVLTNQSGEAAWKEMGNSVPSTDQPHM